MEIRKKFVCEILIKVKDHPEPKMAPHELVDKLGLQYGKNEPILDFYIHMKYIWEKGLLDFTPHNPRPFGDGTGIAYGLYYGQGEVLGAIIEPSGLWYEMNSTGFEYLESHKEKTASERIIQFCMDILHDSARETAKKTLVWLIFLCLGAFGSAIFFIMRGFQ